MNERKNPIISLISEAKDWLQAGEKDPTPTKRQFTRGIQSIEEASHEAYRLKFELEKVVNSLYSNINIVDNYKDAEDPEKQKLLNEAIKTVRNQIADLHLLSKSLDGN